MIDQHSRLWRAVLWALRVSVALECLGLAREAISIGTPVFGFLWNEPTAGGLGWSEPLALTVQQTAGWCLAIAALFALVRPCWPVLVPVALWQLALALSKTWLGGEHFSEISLLSGSTRIVAPLALMLLDPWPRRGDLSQNKLSGSFWLLRLVVAATFVGHGYEALRLHPEFVDYILVAARTLFGWSMSQRTAEVILRIIGTVDVVVAALLVAFRWPAVAYYMAFWGLVTALARIVCAGEGGFSGAIHRTLVRMPHSGAPLAIALYWTLLRRTRRSVAHPTQETLDDESG